MLFFHVQFEINPQIKKQTNPVVYMKDNHLNGVFSPPIVDIAKIVKNSKRNKELISFGQGIPYYNPPDYALDELKKKLVSNENYMHRYTFDEGLPEVIESILKDRSSKGQTTLTRENIVVTAGANLAFYLALSSIVTFGDEVIIPTPFYFNHVMAVQIKQCKPVLIPRKTDLDLDIDEIKKRITSKTKAIVITSPDNPTGAVYSRNTLKEIYELAQQHDFWIIHDETYEQFLYEPEKASHTSMLDFEKDQLTRVISVFSFSKVFGMSGYRAGYLVFPTKLYRNLLKLQDTIIVNCPVVSQMLVKILLDHGTETKTWFDSKFNQLRGVRKYIIDEITDSSYFSLEKNSLSGLGGFYLFPQIIKPEYKQKSLQLVTDLIQKQDLVLLPGIGFGDDWNNYVRISFGNVNLEQVQEGFIRLKEFFK